MKTTIALFSIPDYEKFYKLVIVKYKGNFHIPENKEKIAIEIAYENWKDLLFQIKDMQETEAIVFIQLIRQQQHVLKVAE